MTTNAQDNEQMNVLIRAPRRTVRPHLVSENGRGRIVTTEPAASTDATKNSEESSKGEHDGNQ